MEAIYIILWAFALLCFALAASRRATVKFDLVALGLMFGAAAFLIQTIDTVTG